MILVGRTEAYADGAISFAPDLVDNLERGDRTSAPCWMKLTPMSSATASISRKRRRQGPSGRDSDCINQSHFVLDLAKTG